MMFHKQAIWPGSLRGRLLLGTLVWIVLSVSLAGYGLFRLFEDHVYHQFELTLQSHIDQIMADVGLDDADTLSMPPRLSNPLFEQPYSGLYWQIAVNDQQGWKIALRSTSLWDAALSTDAGKKRGGAHEIAGPQQQRVLALTQELDDVDEQGRRLQITVAGDTRMLSEPLERFHRILLWSLGALAAGLILAAVLQVFLSLYPLRVLRTRLAQVQSGLAQEVQGQFPTEIQPLVEDFNAVLRANTDVVERARSQAGNLAHAVKTPLSILANAADAKEPDLDILVKEQVWLARKQVDHHLNRARASAVRALGGRTAVYPSLASLCRVMSKLHGAIQIVLVQEDQTLVFRGEEQDFQEMVGNLLENACKWAHQQVWCTAMYERDLMHIVIEDDGPGLNEQDLERIFLRGQRADERHPGFGLGLDIVTELARSYKGSLQAGQSERGGLRMQLTLYREV